MKSASTRIAVQLVIGAVVLGLLQGPALVHAQSSGPSLTEGDDKPWNKGVSPEHRTAARDLFLEGNRLFRVPLFAQAVEKYQAALRAWKHPAFYFNLAIAHLNLGQDVEARDNLELALQHGAEALGDTEFREAQKQLAELERSLGRLSITCQTKGAEVTLDGVALFTGPGSYRGWAKAKDHEITAKRSGYVPEARRVTVSPGELRELDLKLVTLTEATDRSRRWAAWKPWAVIAAGGLVAIGGGGLHALSARNFEDYDTKFDDLQCPSKMTSGGCLEAEIPPIVDEQLTKARRQQFLAIGAYATGGALIATGMVLLYMNRPRLGEERNVGSPKAHVAVVPTVSGDSFGLLVSVNR